jgi:hypothetical protein
MPLVSGLWSRERCYLTMICCKLSSIRSRCFRRSHS